MEEMTPWSELFAKKPQVIKPGLDRMRRALARCESVDGQRNYPPIVLVGGTNGKGTTSGYLFQLLARAGLRVGLFSSPHLCDFAERIQCSHRTVGDEQLRSAFASLSSALGTALYDELSFFEVNTLLARQVFLESDCDLWILEVGMGGRWDSTNVFDPLLSVISSVALDHTEYLGPTTSAIAREKSGIMRRQRTVIWGGLGESDPFAHQEILTQARERGASLLMGGRDFALISGDAGGAELKNSVPRAKGAREVNPSMGDGRDPCERLWCQGGRRVFQSPASLDGVPMFLKLNFLKAFSAYLELYDRGVVTGDPQEVLGSFHEVRRPPTLWARFQEFDLRSVAPSTGLGRVVFDVAHNPQGVLALLAALSKRHQGTPGGVLYDGLISILGDKDFNEMLDHLRNVIPSLILFRCGSERSFQKNQLASRHQDLPFTASFAEACALRAQTLDCLETPNRVTIVAGSVYALGEVMQTLGLRPLGGDV